MGKKSSYYLSSLDGLRLVAFLVVFLHHLPGPAAVGIFTTYGWVGVELFFVISAYLLFRLLDAENDKDGSIGVRNFYLRRVLRIYPLLIVYYLVMFVLGGGVAGAVAWFRFATTLLSIDNVATWWLDYNYTVPAVGHLWTLSFEFQVYLLLPPAFLAWKKWGTKRFLWGLLIVETVAFAARFWAVDSGAQYPSIHVIPYLRPESILLGLALAVAKPAWKPGWSVLLAVGAGCAFIAMPDSDMLFVYFPIAVMVAALVDVGLRLRSLRAILSWRPLRYLGTISYGLYVFHLAAIWFVVKALSLSGSAVLANGPVITGMSLGLTIVLAAMSYRYLERPFLRLKRRFTSVDGRASDARTDQLEARHAEAARTDAARRRGSPS